DIHVFVVVPAVLGGGNPVAQEQRVSLKILRLLRLALADELVFQRKRNLSIPLDGGQRRFGPRRHHDQRHLLAKCPALARWLKPRLAKFTGDIVNSEFLAASADAAALQLVAGQVLDGGTNAV